jgi:hypothetical protein
VTTPDEVYELAAKAELLKMPVRPVEADDLNRAAKVHAADFAFRAAVDTAFAAGRRAGEKAAWDRAIRVVETAEVESANANHQRGVEAFQQALVASLRISRRHFPLDAKDAYQDE